MDRYSGRFVGMFLKSPKKKDESSVLFIRQTAAIIGIVNLFIILLAGLYLYQSWQQNLKTIETSTQNLSLVLEKTISAIFSKSDIAIQDIAEEAERQLRYRDLPKDELNHSIIRHYNKLPDIQDLWISDSKGNLVVGGRKILDTIINIADREYFINLRKSPATGVYLSRPVLSRMTNKWVINLVRRINYPDKSFAGVIIASFSIQSFTQIFKGINIGAKGSIALRDTNLFQIARYPESQGIGNGIGHKSTMKELVEHVSSGKTEATFTGTASVDNVVRTYSFRKFPDLPLIILVGRAKVDYSSEWRKSSITVLVLVFIFSGLTAFFSNSIVKRWNLEKLANKQLSHLNEMLEVRILERTEALNLSNKKLICELAERKAAEESLRESEERFRMLFERSNDAIFIVDLITQKYLDANKSAEMLTGRSLHLIKQIKTTDICPDAEKKCVQLYLNPNDPISFGEVVFVRPDLKRRDTLISSIPLKENQVFVIANDITERKKIDKSLKESEIKFQEVINQINDGIVVVDEKGIIIIWNKGSEIILGINANDALDKCIKDIQYKLITKEFKNYAQNEGSIKSIIALSMPEEFDRIIDFEITDPNSGLQKNIQMNVFPVKLEGQSLFCSVFRDNTEIKKKERELIKLNADKNRFISILAHDLKNPFNVILGYLDLLTCNIRKYEINKIEDQLLRIFNSAHQTYNLLEDLLSWARSQSGRMPFEPQMISFPDVYLNVIENLKPNIDQKSISINLFETECGSIYADANMIKTVLRNLISNAIKYSYYNGQIDVWLWKLENKIEVTIKDRGIGIDQLLIAKLFDISEIYTTEGTEKEKGNGLGLILCKEFVERHGGEIWIKSELGKGSEFIFSLPLKDKYNNLFT